MEKTQKYQGITIKAEFITKKVMKCRIQHINPDKLEFIAGQYITIMLGDHQQRAYSIASAPKNINYIELYVDISPGGVGSKFFENIKIGDKIDYFAPMGRFIYVEKERPVLFISTGTGIAPFLSMIEYSLNNNSKRKIRLLEGLKYKNEIFTGSLLKKWSANAANFSFDYCLSREETWEGKKGRVTKFLEQEILILGRDIDIYICGFRAMIESVEQELARLGIDKEAIQFEKY